MGAESLERPALVHRPDGGWRLYLSCATWNSKHWWVECLDADDVKNLPGGTRTVVFPGDHRLALKDPVVTVDGDGWHAWVCCHPLDEPGQEDRMWSAYARSADGLVWSEPVPVLRPDGEGWDARGTRVTAVLPGGPLPGGPLPGGPLPGGPLPGGNLARPGLVAYYDGRPDAAQNWYEQTGLAVAAAPGDAAGDAAAPLTALGDRPLAGSPVGTGALRYLCVVPLPGGGYQLFYEASRADGAHDLVTQRVPPSVV
jgi:hypothetical protein